MAEPIHASAPVQAITGICIGTSARLLETLGTCPAVTAIWLFGSRAMGRHHTGSDLDRCLEGPAIEHADRLRLMAAMDELLLP
jgi:predicted nucleotidyltransferase